MNWRVDEDGLIWVRARVGWDWAWRCVGGVAVAVSLTACATDNPPPPVQTVTVKVPVPVPCDPHLSPSPVYADSDAAIRAAPDLFERVKLLVAGRLQRIARERELQAAVEGCSK